MKAISSIAHPDRKIQPVIYHRLEVIEFFRELGLPATKKAFKVGRSTIFSWQQTLSKFGNKLSSLAPKSKRPKIRSKRKVLLEHQVFSQQYRISHPGVCKDTIKPILDTYCKTWGIPTISESTIGRVITDLKTRRTFRSRMNLTLT